MVLQSTSNRVLFSEVVGSSNCNRTGVMHIERPFSHSVGIIAALCGTATKIERFQGRSKMLGSRKVVRNVFRAPDKRRKATQGDVVNKEGVFSCSGIKKFNQFRHFCVLLNQ